MNKIKEVRISRDFWCELDAIKSKETYRRIRKCFAVHSLKALQGMPHGFATLTNPVFKGLTHLSTPGVGMAIFTKIDGSTLLVLGVVEHGDYGFNRKNSSRERTTAAKMNERVSKAFGVSPNWSNFKWTKPGDIVESKELHEYSLEALNHLKEELDNETLSLWKFSTFAVKNRKFDRVQLGQSWVNEILKADELVSMHIARICREMCVKGNVQYDCRNFQHWIDEDDWETFLLAA